MRRIGTALLFLGLLGVWICSQAPSWAQTNADTPQWQVDAGGKMSFDVVSVKRHPYDPASPYYIPHSNFTLDSSDSYKATGGLMSTENIPAARYIVFAYKLSSDDITRTVFPKWASNEHFDVEARGPENATKDQMRLMMQSLLADRFKLAVHWENRQTPVFAVVLVKAGKTGPQLQPSDDAACNASPNGSGDKQQGKATGVCGQAGMRYLPNGESQVIGRKQTMQQIAPLLRLWPGTGLDRSLIDGTGLSGTFDFQLAWTPEAQPGAQQADAQGPSYLDALRDQLGLKLDPSTAMMPVLVIDHVEEPAAN